MDSYEIDAIKTEKARAISRYRTFQKIAATFKVLEIFVAVVVVSWSVFRSSEYAPAFLRRVFSLLLSPHFVFFIGNVIIVALFANSRESSYTAEIFSGEVEFAGNEFSGELEAEIAVIPDEEKVIREVERKTYRRTKSATENMIGEEENSKAELRRSKTVSLRKNRGGDSETETEARKMMYGEDGLSSEEFRKRVEAFIEKQQMFLREESKAVVLTTNAAR